MRPVNAKIPIPWPRINGSICLKDSAGDTGLESVSKATISQALVESETFFKTWARSRPAEPVKRGRGSAARSILRQAAHSARTGTNHYHLKRVGDRSGCVTICDCRGHGCLHRDLFLRVFRRCGPRKREGCTARKKGSGATRVGILRGDSSASFCDCAAEPQTAPLSSPRAATRPGRDCSMLGKTPQRCRLGPARGWGTKLYRLPCTLKSVSGAGLHIAQPVAATGA